MINVKLIIRYLILDTRYWMNKAAKFAPNFHIQHPSLPRLRPPGVRLPVAPPGTRSQWRTVESDGGQAVSSI